ncbi:MAG: VanW family protein [Coriobacteriales bacterium]|jgi:CDP-diacylglycerol--glycerol-3-phosphate 3-phosphatidyltransferase|nr:VanW family protein [Coriobacteriales bacterium]
MPVEPTDRILTIPNLITLLRLLLVPLAFVLLVEHQNNVAAFLVYGVAATTDFLDGLVARSTGQVSRLGQQLDPLVDRALILSAVIAVFIVGRVPLWLLVVLVGRDLVLLLLSIHMLRVYHRRFEVVFTGKVATALIMAGFSLLILNGPQLPGLGLFNTELLPGWGSEPASLGIWLLYVGCPCSLAAGAIYLYRGTRPTADEMRESRVVEKVRAASSTHPSRTRPRPPLGSSARPARHATFPDSPPAHPPAGGSQQFARTPAATAPTQPARRAASTELARPARRAPLGHSKFLLLIALAVVLLAGAGFYAFDSIRNWGSIHSGVSVAGIDVGNLTRDEAAALLNESLSRRVDLQPVDVFANEAARAAGINDQTVHFETGVDISEAANSPTSDASANPETAASSWRVSADSLGLAVDGASLAEKAFNVGRGADFLLGRIAANLFGVRLDAMFTYSGSKRARLEEDITRSVGTPLVNSNVVYQDGSFQPVAGTDGHIVNSGALTALLDAAFLGGEREIIAPMTDKAQEIRLDEATALAKQLETLTATAFTLTFEDQSFPVPTDSLRSWVSTVVERDESGGATLVALFDAEKIKAGIKGVIGDLNPGIAPVEASFTVVDGVLSVVPGEQGLGVDFPVLAAELDSLVLGENSKASSAPIPIGPLNPILTTEKAQAFSFPEKISEFTTYYWESTPTRTSNVHLAADYANSSIIAPGAVWSFNEHVGEYTLERGFTVDQAVVGNTYEDAIGGGVCQTASTIFNAVYDAGLPILERSNHAIYMGYYPDGRDAAIAWPYADLKFKNDTSSYLLLMMSYDEVSVTAMLWGVNPGYRVESQASEWEEGEKFSTKEVKTPELPEGEKEVKIPGKDGRAITVTRIVYNSDGSKRAENTFRSVYISRTEVIEVGTGTE